MVSLGQRKLGGYTVGISGITAIAGPSFKQNDLGSFSLGGFNLGSGEEVSNIRVSASTTAIDDSASRIFFGQFVTISEELGTESLGAFNLGSERTVSDSTASAIASVQDDSFSRVNEEDEVIMSNTFFSPVFEGTQNLVRSGDSVLLTSSEFVNNSDTSTRTGDIISRVASEFIIDGVVLGSDGDIVSSQRKILDNSFSRSSFTDNALLRTASIFTDSFASTLESDIVLTIQTAIFINEFASSTDGDVHLSSTNALDNSFSRLFNGDITNILTDTFGNTFTKKIEDEEIVMSNTFFAPVFDGTQNLVRDGDVADSLSSVLQSTQNLTVGELLSIAASQQVDEVDTKTISGNTISRATIDLVANGFVLASDGNVTLSESFLLDNSFSRNLFTDEALLRTASIFTDTFTSTLEKDIALTIQSALLSDELVRSIDGNVQLQNTESLDDSLSRLNQGDVLDRQLDPLGNTFTKTLEEDEVTMSNTFFAPIFDGTQNLVRAGDPISADTIEQSPTISLTVGDVVARESNVEFNEANVLASAGHVLERVTERLFQESSKTTISGNALTRVLEQVFDDTFIAASDGDAVSLIDIEFTEQETKASSLDDTTVLVELNILDSSFSRTFAEDVVIISNKLSENSLGQFQIGQEEEVLSTNRVLSETAIENNSVSQGVAGNTVAVTIDEFVEEVTRVLDGEIFELESSLFADTFTKTIEEDETIMSNTFFAPVFDGTQNLVRSGSISESFGFSVTDDSFIRSVADDTTITENTLGEESLGQFKIGEEEELLRRNSVTSLTTPEFNDSDNTSIRGDIVQRRSTSLDPEYLFTVNPGVFVRELGVDDTSNIGQMILGNNKLGAGTVLDGTINRVDPFTSRNLLLDRIDITSSISGAGTARQIVNDLIIRRLSNIVILESIARKFDGEIATIDSSQFVNELTRTFDGSIPLALSEQIQAFRVLTEWALGPRQLGTTIEETREWQLLEVTIRYDEQNEQDVRNILSKSGKANILEDPSGGFKTIDTGVNNDIGLNAPTDREKLRTVDTWYLDDYDKELVNRDGTVYDVTFELIPQIEKSFDNEYGSFESEPTDTQQTSLWYFDFEFGSFATNRVSIATEEVGDGTTDVIEMNLILKEDEARIIEENASYLNTVFLREIPDNADRLDDTSEDTRQTVDITPPNGRDEPIPADSYVIRTWETEWTGNVFNVAMEVGRE